MTTYLRLLPMSWHVTVAEVEITQTLFCKLLKDEEDITSVTLNDGTWTGGKRNRCGKDANVEKLEQ